MHSSTGETTNDRLSSIKRIEKDRGATSIKAVFPGITDLYSEVSAKFNLYLSTTYLHI